MGGITLVVANGDWPSDELMEALFEQAGFIIALDGAADRFQGWDLVVGDMDSIDDSTGHEASIGQDDSDLSKALFSHDVDAVVGVSGGRLDHTVAAFASLFESESDAILYFDGWRVCRVPSEGLSIELIEGTRCSLMPFGKVESVTLSGCEFNLDFEDLSTGSRGVGNKALGGEVSIAHNRGDLLFIWAADEP